MSDGANDGTARQLGKLLAIKSRLSEKLDAATARLKELEQERDTYKAQAESTSTKLAEAKKSPGDLQAKLDEALGTLRKLKHAEVFKSLHEDKELGLNPKVTPERLMQLLGYEAEGDEPDPKTIRERVAALKDSDGYLFSEPAGETPESSPGRGNAQAETQRAPGPGLKRGALDTSAGGYTVRRSDTADPEWMRANQGEFAAASAAGRVRWVD